jgi:hypothetical protein
MKKLLLGAVASGLLSGPVLADPQKLDDSVLDTVNAGNGSVLVQVFGDAAGSGNLIGSAEVEYITEAEGNESGGSGFGFVYALGVGIGEDAAANSETRAVADGDLAYTQSFRKVFGGGGSSFDADFSASIGWAASLAP